MSDVTCPYCGHQQEINHDDGYGYEEDVKFDQDCTNCGHSFHFTPTIVFLYSVECEDVKHHTYIERVAEHLIEYCKNCDHRKRLEEH